MRTVDEKRNMELKKRKAELYEKIEKKAKLILELGLVDTAQIKQDCNELKGRFDDFERWLKESRAASEAQIRMLINRLDNK